MVGTRWKDWNTIPTCSRRNRASASSERPVSERPATLTDPEVGASKPAATIRSEDFPDPEGPSNATASPGSTASVTPLRMLTAPAALANVRRTSSSTMDGTRVARGSGSRVTNASMARSGDSDDAAALQDNSSGIGSYVGHGPQRKCPGNE